MAQRVEAADIQDADIANQSVIENGDKPGLIRFVYKNEDGTELVHSEWMQAQNKRRALLPWCAAVRNALVAQSEEAVALERRKLADARTVIQTSNLPALPPVGNLSIQSAAPSAELMTLSPKDYVKEQLNLWNIRAIEAAGAMQEAKEQYDEASAKLKQWAEIAKGLGVTYSEREISSVGVGGSSKSAAGSSGCSGALIDFDQAIERH